MDYNKNGFQSQNFQLVGEDNKFSANLRSFGLPTFDLDEHLRFDSLVGTEDLLGVQAQRNNWIDFPSGSSAIEFSSSASESCSISRHRNVWSEVTSSESVDLLLKSMGEDELITKKTVIIDASSNNRSHDIDNQVDLYVGKKDVHKLSLMDILPCDQELMQDKCQETVVGPIEGQRDLLLHLQGSSKVAEVEETRVALFMGPSNGKFSSYGKITDGEGLTDRNATSLLDATEKSTVVGKVLCQAVSIERDVSDVFTSIDAPNTDDHDSCVVASKSPESNQDVKLVMVTEKGIGLFSDGQHMRNISNMSGLLYDNSQKEKSLVIPSDEKTNNQLVRNPGALKVLNTICSDSMLPEKTDGFVAVIPCRTKSLNGDSEAGGEISEKEECMSPLAMEQEAKIENNSCNISSTASLKMYKLTESYRSVVGRLPYDSVEDDNLQRVGNQLIKNLTVSSDDGGKNTCMYAIDNKQGPEGQLVGNNNTEVKLLTELHATIHVNFENQLARIEDCDRMSPKLRSLTCGKFGSVAEGDSAEDMGVDRQDVKLDADKDADPHEYSLSDDMIDAETKTSPSTSVIDVSHDKESSVPCTESGRINIVIISNVMEKVQGLPHDRHIAEEVSFDGSSVNKMVDEELDSALVAPGFEKSTYLHLPPPQDATDDAVVVEKNERLTQKLSAPETIHFDKKDVKISEVSASTLQNIDLLSEKASDPAFISYLLHMKETSPVKAPQDDSALAKLAPVKSTNSQLSQCTDGLNLAREQKEEPSLCLAIPDLFDYEENKMKLSEESRLSNCRKRVDKETLTQADTDSDYVKDTLVNSSREHHPNTGLQPLSLVPNFDATSCQNVVPSSAVGAVGNGETLLPGGNCISHGSSGEGTDDALKSSGVFFDVRNEASVSVAEAADFDDRQEVHLPPSRDNKCSNKSPSNEQDDQCNLAIRVVSNRQIMSARSEDNVLHSQTNDSSQMSTVGTAESNSSNLQSVNPSSSEHNCGSPKVINFNRCPQDDSKQQESLGASGSMVMECSEKDETTHKVECRNNDVKQRSISIEDSGFNFRVTTSGDLPESAAGSERNSFTSLQSIDIPPAPKENSQACPEEVEVLEISTKTPKGGKPKSVSRSSNEKKAGSKGKRKQEASALKQSSEMNVEYSSTSHGSVGILSKDVPSVEMQEHSSIEFSTPFTDLQQVQLRAQIFVYGALLSGMPPDEVYMVSAFGGADGGRSLWEGVWHVSVARFQNKKSAIGGDETPPHYRTGDDVQTKVPSTSAAKSASMIISSAVLNSTVPLPSPLWSLSYGDDRHHASISRGSYPNFSQTPYPLSPCHTTQSRQHIGAYLPWSSQSPRPGSWFASSQGSSLDGITQYSTVPVTETVHAMPVRDLCGPYTTSKQVSPPSVLMSTPDPTATTTEAVLQLETTKGTTIGSIKYTQSTQKARKRKKAAAAEEPCLPASQTLGKSFSALGVVKSIPLPSASMMLSSNPPVKVATGAPVLTSTSHIISPTHYQVIGDNSNQQKVINSEETCSKIGQAKLQAEDAAALAASTVKHSQAIWSQLAVQKNSGILSQIEEKLASAAVAVAAAASVAKAAAAAAKIASCAALQSKIMVDEAMSAAKSGSTVLNPESGILDVGKRLAGLTPISILNGMDKIHGSGAVISAAREVARRRVESASASSKRAENLDAIVKAAELTAEAVAQAGILITMGDPLPFTLSELVDENFKKGHHGASMKLSKPSSMYEQEHLGLCNVEKHCTSPKQFNEQFSTDIEIRKTANEGRLSSLNEFEGTAQGNPTAGHESECSISYFSIQKGSTVEIMSDEDGLRGAWFSAKVLDIRDNKAYVCYNDVSTDEGLLKEWIVLEEGDKAPKIRVSCSKMPVNIEGTRKRYREQLGSYTWAVGDHVDAWMHDRWWEGTVIEKSPGDETKLTVYFPARGDKQVVHAWNLRTSLIWKDGQWKEWSHPRAQLKPHEGDTPKEKRQRLGCVEEATHLKVDAAVTGNFSKNVLIEESKKPEGSRSLVLSAKERIFSLGKNSKQEGTSDALKAKRTGLQKEGSRVVFGVPRPGKRRKFMEVSKHYVVDKSEKISEGNDSIKFANCLMPQASFQLRNSLKVNNKGKKAVERKPKGGIKTENSRSLQTRRQVEKDNALTTSNVQTSHVCHGNVVTSFKGKINSLDKNAIKFSSKVRSESSMRPALTAPLSKKKNAPCSEADLAVKAKSTIARTSDKGLGNLGKALHEVMEPRRSNRRIQPTSRLLEGLQSSLIISKMPRTSDERKSHRGGPSSSRGNTHG